MRCSRPALLLAVLLTASARAEPPVEPVTWKPPPGEAARKLIAPPAEGEPEWVAAGSSLRTVGKVSKLRPPVLIREDEPPRARPAALPPIPITEPPGTVPAPPPVVAVAAQPTSPGVVLPAIPPVPDVPLPAPAPAPAPPPQPLLLPAPSVLPPLAAPEGPVPTGPIDVNGNPVTFDALSRLVDGNLCPGCGGGLGAGGCASCGGNCAPGRPCPPGIRPCEPFPARTAVGRVIGLIYASVCCPDPCYQPRWEPLADAGFFTDAARPKSATKFRWDYGHHLSYPDRGEYFWARADGNGKGPTANSLVRAVPFVDYHELTLVTEVAMGNAGVQIAVPYRSVNSTPYGPDGAGFADMHITAKTLLLDSELALFGFQMRTYIPIGNFRKGLGTGHVSLEPGLNFGLRCSPETYLQAQVVEWIPLGGDTDYQGAHLRWSMSVSRVLWRPVKDVQLIGTLETTGISFQDGLFTDPALGPQKLSGQTAAGLGAGFRLFFCDTFDLGAAWHHGITGKSLVRDQMRFELRYRY